MMMANVMACASLTIMCMSLIIDNYSTLYIDFSDSVLLEAILVKLYMNYIIIIVN